MNENVSSSSKESLYKVFIDGDDGGPLMKDCYYKIHAVVHKRLKYSHYHTDYSHFVNNNSNAMRNTYSNNNNNNNNSDNTTATTAAAADNNSAAEQQHPPAAGGGGGNNNDNSSSGGGLPVDESHLQFSTPPPFFNNHHAIDMSQIFNKRDGNSLMWNKKTGIMLFASPPTDHDQHQGQQQNHSSNTTSGTSNGGGGKHGGGGGGSSGGGAVDASGGVDGTGGDGGETTAGSASSQPPSPSAVGKKKVGVDGGGDNSNNNSNNQNNAAGMMSSNSSRQSFCSELRIPSFREFAKDLHEIMMIVNNEKCHSACRQRLDTIQESSKTLMMLNAETEAAPTFYRAGGVLADVAKVDNSVRLARAMTAEELLELVMELYQHHGSEIVLRLGDGSNITLHEFFAINGVDDPVDRDSLTIEGLGWHVSSEQAERGFDIYDTNHCPDLPIAAKLSRLLLQFEGGEGTEVAARVIKRLLGRESTAKSTAGEYRAACFGYANEIRKIVSFFHTHNVGPYRNSMWFLNIRPVDLPKHAVGMKERHQCQSDKKSSFLTDEADYVCPPNIHQMLDNIFTPLVRATMFPNDPQNVTLARWLECTGGLHIESFSSKRLRQPLDEHAPEPVMQQYDTAAFRNLHETYCDYYLWANAQALNALRARRGMNLLQLRRGIGAADLSCMISAYLLADVATNAARMAEYPVLLYGFGAHQVGITVSPLFNHVALDIRMDRNPVSQFLHQGLKVAVATEEPLHYHHDSHALLEELATAQKLVGLSKLDIAELCRNSVLLSTFPNSLKRQWLGDRFTEGPLGGLTSETSTGESKCHVSRSRYDFRQSAWIKEMDILSELEQASRESKGGSQGAQVMRFDPTYALSTVNDHTFFAIIDRRRRFPRTVIVNPSQAELKASSSSSSSAAAAKQQQIEVDDGGMTTEPPHGSDDDHGHQQQNRGEGDMVEGRRGKEFGGAADDDFDDEEEKDDADHQSSTSRPHTGGAAMMSNDARPAERLINALHMRRKYIFVGPAPWERRTSGESEAEDMMAHSSAGGGGGNGANGLSGAGATGPAGGVNGGGGAGGGVNGEKTKNNSKASELSLQQIDGVLFAFRNDEIRYWPRELPTVEMFHHDFMHLKGIVDNVSVKDLAHRRMELLDYKFRLHVALNQYIESGTSESRIGMPNRDVYHATKVDTHIHMAAGMTGRHLKEFLVNKLKTAFDDVVGVDRTSKELITLEKRAKQLGVTEKITVDQLNVQADHTLFERFDNFNKAYNPMGEVELRNIILKTDNLMKGRYFAEVIQQTFQEYSKDQYTYAENRLSIYGRDIREWDMLANWFSTHGMANKHNKWLIQVPRVYSVWRNINAVNSYAHYLENIFKPMWEASINPAQHPFLNAFLNHVSGFDSVDNEATVDLAFEPKPPGSWRSAENPPYNYYMYYLWANIRTLNEYRSKKGLSTFTLRPHCGESGSDDHLIGCYLVADSINHGINLTHDPSMEYLYYLAQIGLAVSPLSNNALFLSYLKNPFPQFFHRGMNVSLSTDDPLMFHQTKEPLIEEYAIAQMVWGFTNNDLCEIARNSVLQCGFDHEWKKEKIGSRYFFSSSIGNQPSKTHLSDVRVAYRWEAYHAEVAFLEEQSGHTRFVPKAMTTIQEENAMFEHEHMPQEAVLCTVHDEEVAVVQREIEEVNEVLMSAKSDLTRARHQTKVLVEHVGEEVTKIEELQAEIARLEQYPAPLSTRQYTGKDLRKRGVSRATTARQQLASQLAQLGDGDDHDGDDYDDGDEEEEKDGSAVGGGRHKNAAPRYFPNKLLRPVFNATLASTNNTFLQTTTEENTMATREAVMQTARQVASSSSQQQRKHQAAADDFVLPQTRQFAGAFAGFVKADNTFDEKKAQHSEANAAAAATKEGKCKAVGCGCGSSDTSRNRRSAAAGSGYGGEHDGDDGVEAEAEEGKKKDDMVIDRLHAIGGPCCGIYANDTMGKQAAAEHYAAVDHFYNGGTFDNDAAAGDGGDNGGSKDTNTGVKLPPLPPNRRNF